MHRSVSGPTTKASGQTTDPKREPFRIESGRLLDWFEAEGRDLPWRRTRDPWTILVSELMLQQTQAARVATRLHRFLQRFPSPAECADRPVGDVIDEWSGLGYNRRAVNLHRTAVQVRDVHGGVVPSALADLLALPGIGPYTARAVRSFAFEIDDGVIDTNVGRVLARVGGVRLGPAAAQRLADELVPAGHGWVWNQAIMELGAVVCRPNPGCDACPIARGCAWQGTGPDPARGSAAVSRSQSRFDGSDRQGRGRLVDALRKGPIEFAELPKAMWWPDDPARAQRVARGVVADGLAAVDEAGFRLP